MACVTKKSRFAAATVLASFVGVASLSLAAPLTGTAAVVPAAQNPSTVEALPQKAYYRGHRYGYHGYGYRRYHHGYRYGYHGYRHPYYGHGRHYYR